MKMVEQIYIEKNLKYNLENTILVAGTNGKGSTCKYLEEIFKNNFKIGVFTSPHIYSEFERIRINGKNIEEEIFRKYEKKYSEYDINFFEKYFLIACDYFKDEKVDILVFEVGIGGLLDTTNILDSKYAIITSISYDHTNILGNTLEEIAYQKSGICKNDKICVYNKEIEILNKYVDKFTKNKILLEKDEKFLELCGKIGIYKEEQKNNFLNVYKIAKDYNIKDEDIIESLKDIKIPFRQEYIVQKEINKNIECIVDVSHNEDSFEKLINYLELYYKNKKYIFLISMLKTKDIKTVYEKIRKISENIYFYAMPNEHNGMTKEEISKKLNIDLKEIREIENNLNDEIRKIDKDLDSDNKLFILCGSFYFVSKFIR